jgi:glycerol-3-phosphate acyltransferase PlsY
MTLALALVLSYLIGAIPWSWLAGRLVGHVDLRTVGSGNLGATNTFRALGARVAIPVLVLDILKGVAAVLWVAPLAYGQSALSSGNTANLCGLSAILGHMYPVYLRFRGGKGIATSAGVFLALEPVALGLCFLAFVLTFALSGGIVSLGSLVSSLVLPLAVYGVGKIQGHVDAGRLIVALALVLVVWVRHTSNITRLLHGEEKSVFAGRRGRSR